MSSEAVDPVARAHAQLLLIGARALTSNLRRVDELTMTVNLLTSEGGLPEGSRDNAMTVAHQLAGSAGTFGYERVSHLARQVERFLLEQSFADPRQCLEVAQDLVLAREDLLAGPDEDLD